MLTRDRVIRIRFSTGSASPHIHSRFSQRRCRVIRFPIQPQARVESNPEESLDNMRPSYACRLYAASAT
jgi:hypothetical protein